MISTAFIVIAGCSGKDSDGTSQGPKPDTGIEVLDDTGGDTSETDETDTIDTAEEARELAEYESLFDAGTLHEVRIGIAQILIDELILSPDVYVLASLEIDGVVLPESAVRLKGSAEDLDWYGKPSFKIDFDEFNSENKLAGIQRLGVDAMNGDVTMARAFVGSQLLNSVGFVAPRVAYSQVWVNEELFGLYLLEENLDDDFLDRHLDGDGALFEAEDGSDFTPAGAEYFDHVAGSNVDEELREARIVVQTGGADFYTAADTVLDMTQFLHFWAWRIGIGDGAGYPYRLDDYLIHWSEADERFRFHPWGVEGAWEVDVLSDWYAQQGTVAVHCYYQQACLDLFLAEVSAVLLELDTTDVSIHVQTAETVSNDVVADDIRKPWSTSEVTTGRTQLAALILGWPDRVRGAMGVP